MGSFLVVASFVLLTLLLAPDAYLALGSTFGVLLLAVVALVAAAGRSGRRAAGVSRLDVVGSGR